MQQHVMNEIRQNPLGGLFPTRVPRVIIATHRRKDLESSCKILFRLFDHPLPGIVRPRGDQHDSLNISVEISVPRKE